MSDTMSFGKCKGITFSKWKKLPRTERAEQCKGCTIHSCRVRINGED